MGMMYMVMSVCSFGCRRLAGSDLNVFHLSGQVLSTGIF